MVLKKRIWFQGVEIVESYSHFFKKDVPVDGLIFLKIYPQKCVCF